MIRRVFDEPNPFMPELKRKRENPNNKPSTSSTGRQFKSRAIPPEQRIKTRLQSVDAYTRHKMMINNYVTYYRGSTTKLQRDTSNDKNDFDIIRENHRFLWSDAGMTEAEADWGARLAKRYYDKLFKEYCIVDLTKYKQNVYAMRWRIEKELFSGKGQFECGNKYCKSREELSSWEVNFAYTEHGVRKNALVKVRLCPECSTKLNFHNQKRLIKKEKKELKSKIKSEKDEEKEEKRRKRKERKNKKIKKLLSKTTSSSSSSDASEGEESEESKNVEELEQKLSEEEKRKIDEEAAKKVSEASAQSASEIWSSKTAVLEADKTADEEFDEFIDDLLL
uniref:Protein FRA10AC1 homolog n=1 Tax=Meloidogyne hapla TaxID=6305 RepID=A0A1I8BX66_MELHA